MSLNSKKVSPFPRHTQMLAYITAKLVTHSTAHSEPHTHKHTICSVRNAWSSRCLLNFTKDRLLQCLFSFTHVDGPHCRYANKLVFLYSSITGDFELGWVDTLTNDMYVRGLQIECF
jgi:hypothetical protein